MAALSEGIGLLGSTPRPIPSPRVCTLSPGSFGNPAVITNYSPPVTADLLYPEIVRSHLAIPSLVSEEHAHAALAFVDLLAPDAPMPLVVVSGAGEIGLCWSEGEKTLILVPEKCGTQLRYVAEFGRERRQGWAPYGSVMPTLVAEILDAFGRTLH